MKLSIITINYNNKAGLEKTVASVMAQTWRSLTPSPSPEGEGSPWEWIIIDGGSTDGSAEVIEELAKNPESNISYWCSERDKGVYNAMNKGIAKAHGEYLNFMNSGDIFYAEDTLENVFATEHTADIVYGDWKRIWSDHEDIHSFPYPVDVYAFYKDNISHQAMFIRREFQLKNLYDESYYILADYRNWGQAVLKGATFEHIVERICIVTMDGISCQGGERCNKEYKRLCDELWTEPLRLTLTRYDHFLRDPYLCQVRDYLNNGGLPAALTVRFLNLMRRCFKR